MTLKPPPIGYVLYLKATSERQGFNWYGDRSLLGLAYKSYYRWVRKTQGE